MLGALFEWSFSNRGSAGVFENGTTHTNSAICSATAAAPGKFVETMNSFSDSDDESISVLVENVPGNPGATIQGIIVDV